VRILLVKPSPRLGTIRGLQSFQFLEPLELGYLAAAAPDTTGSTAPSPPARPAKLVFASAEETAGSGVKSFAQSGGADLVADALDGALPIIGVGGILCGDDAKEKIDAGATLVQVYTGLIYRGPELIAECARALAPAAR